jgi:hypothetical protein
MAKFALALSVILLLALSAGFTQIDSDRASATHQAHSSSFVERRALTGDVGLVLSGGTAPALGGRLPAAPPGDRPAPALLVYLAFVLIGSAISVAIVRRNQGRDR